MNQHQILTNIKDYGYKGINEVLAVYIRIEPDPTCSKVWDVNIPQVYEEALDDLCKVVWVGIHLQEYSVPIGNIVVKGIEEVGYVLVCFCEIAFYMVQVANGTRQILVHWP